MTRVTQVSYLLSDADPSVNSIITRVAFGYLLALPVKSSSMVLMMACAVYVL